MNEKTLKKRLDFQQNIISKKSEEIKCLKIENEKLRLEIQEKDELINSVSPLIEELNKNIGDAKTYKEEFRKVIGELKKMKEVMNKSVFKGRWKLVRLLIK